MKIKICGITNLDDALHAVQCGADVLGFNFYQRSPRYVSPGAVRDIIGRLPRHITTVGVFVNASLDEIDNVCKRAFVGQVQLHGDETPGLVESLTSEGTTVIKAIHASDSFDPNSALEYYVDEFYTDFVQFLLDTPSAGRGGSGKVFDWSLALKFKAVVPEFYLAGGLTPDNVADAIRVVRPTAVDVCSGVEAHKGKKDPEKVAAFVEAVRSVS